MPLKFNEKFAVEALIVFLELSAEKTPFNLAIYPTHLCHSLMRHFTKTRLRYTDLQIEMTKRSKYEILLWNYKYMKMNGTNRNAHIELGFNCLINSLPY